MQCALCKCESEDMFMCSECFKALMEIAEDDEEIDGG